MPITRLDCPSSYWKFCLLCLQSILPTSTWVLENQGPSLSLSTSGASQGFTQDLAHSRCSVKMLNEQNHDAGMRQGGEAQGRAAVAVTPCSCPSWTLSPPCSQARLFPGFLTPGDILVTRGDYLIICHGGLSRALQDLQQHPGETTQYVTTQTSQDSTICPPARAQLPGMGDGKTSVSDLFAALGKSSLPTLRGED